MPCTFNGGCAGFEDEDEDEDDTDGGTGAVIPTDWILAGGAAGFGATGTGRAGAGGGTAAVVIRGAGAGAACRPKNASLMNAPPVTISRMTRTGSAHPRPACDFGACAGGGREMRTVSSSCWVWLARLSASFRRLIGIGSPVNVAVELANGAAHHVVTDAFGLFHKSGQERLVAQGVD